MYEKTLTGRWAFLASLLRAKTREDVTNFCEHLDEELGSSATDGRGDYANVLTNASSDFPWARSAERPTVDQCAPVLNDLPQELRVQFTETPRALAPVGASQGPVRLPALEDQFDLPANAIERPAFLETEAVLRDIGNENIPFAV